MSRKSGLAGGTMQRGLRCTGVWLCALVSLAGCGDEPAEPAGMAVTGGGLAGPGGSQSGGISMAPPAGGSFAAPTGGSTGLGSGGMPAPTGGVTAPEPSGSVPCDVRDVIAQNCWKCHGEVTNWGGPMSLVTREDFLATGKITIDEVVADLVKARINDSARPMPPTTEPTMSAEDLSALNQWLDAGMPAGSEPMCEAISMPDESMPDGTGGTGDRTEWADGPGWPGGVAPQETCYEFLKHGAQTPNDTSPHMTENGETYVNFFHKVPWTEPVIATSWRTIYDNTLVLHHWLLYESSAPASRDGNWTSTAAAGLAGTHGGSVKLVAGWAVGGGDETFPEGVGLRMPPPGGMFELEWHLYNTTGARVPDRSGIEVCVVPESAVDPQYVAGLTWLGTENLVIAPNGETQNGGICTPSFKNGEPVTILKFLPHMHTIGIHMDSWVLRADGSVDHVFSEPFQFDRQISYDMNPPVVLNRGDRIHSVCTFRNPSAATVLFGQSTDLEMCYQFAVAYPAGSLDGVAGGVLTGADNGCLSLNIPPSPSY